MNQPGLHTTIAELLARWPSARGVVGRRGMACIGCTMARFETIVEAAAAYGFDADEFIQEVYRAGKRIGFRRSRSRGPGAAPRARI